MMNSEFWIATLSLSKGAYRRIEVTNLKMKYQAEQLVLSLSKESRSLKDMLNYNAELWIEVISNEVRNLFP